MAIMNPHMSHIVTDLCGDEVEAEQPKVVTWRRRHKGVGDVVWKGGVVGQRAKHNGVVGKELVDGFEQHHVQVGIDATVRVQVPGGSAFDRGIPQNTPPCTYMYRTASTCMILTGSRSNVGRNQRNLVVTSSSLSKSVHRRYVQAGCNDFQLCCHG